MEPINYVVEKLCMCIKYQTFWLSGMMDYQPLLKTNTTFLQTSIAIFVNGSPSKLP